MFYLDVCYGELFPVCSPQKVKYATVDLRLKQDKQVFVIQN